jgi:type I restriction enzyme M protein
MRLLSVAKLTEDLWKAADILRGSIDASEYLDIVSRILILKRASDQPGFLRVPDRAQWSHIVVYPGKELGHVLDEALRHLEHSNPEVLDGVMDGYDLSRRLGPAQLQALVDHFNDIPLGDDNLEFSDALGLAYNRALRWFGERAGKKGGEFYTPASVVELMVRLVEPHEGQSIYDPFVGSGSMLAQAKQYVDEHGEVGASLSLFGQEKNVSMSSIARLNLLLNGVTGGSILCGDTLERPMHTLADGHLRLFDRVLTNPPFSMSYDKKELKYPDRMKYGWTSKQADLMNVQHVLAVLRPEGVGAVVTPHGVLFRGGAEAEIRQGILEDCRIEAVIGIGANVFYGTALPACILVLRGKNGLPMDRRDSVLFINAEREVASGRTRNRLEPAHVEKIVQTFRERSEIPGFSRVVSLGEIAQNDFNLNIRRYVDASPPAEAPLDVRGALFGGVPRREVQAEVPRFQALGIGLVDLFRVRDPGHLDFLPEGYKVTAERLQELSAPCEHEFFDHYRNWWERTRARITGLAGTGRLMMLRSDLMNSFSIDLLSQGLLDQYQLRGAFADWWSDHHDDFRSLDLRGFAGLIDRWAKARRPPASHAPERSAHDRVLDTLGDDLRARVEKLVFSERQELADTYRSWGERYATSLIDLEEQREVVAARLKARIQELGYSDPA